MTLSNIRAGQIWQVRDSDALALVVFLHHDEFFGEDLRVLPVFAGAGHTAVATDLDVVVPPEETSMGKQLLVNCWNGQSLSRQDLAQLVGEVSHRALDASRAVELTGIAPEHAASVPWRGGAIGSDSDVRLVARMELYREWEDLRVRLLRFREAVRRNIPRSAYSHRALFRGRNPLGLGGQMYNVAFFFQPSDDTVVVTPMHDTFERVA